MPSNKKLHVSGAEVDLLHVRRLDDLQPLGVLHLFLDWLKAFQNLLAALHRGLLIQLLLA
jgi:hypothetical protein